MQPLLHDAKESRVPVLAGWHRRRARPDARARACACGAPGDSQTTTTFARSFGGPGDDFAVDLATDASGRLVVAGVYSEPLIGGGSSERLWLLGLDEAGNASGTK
ncbi:MAG: hypothetical protein R3F21_13020 [Myxococcota bacterium]